MLVNVYTMTLALKDFVVETNELPPDMLKFRQCFGRSLADGALDCAVGRASACPSFG